jgi:small GTP-binding protein
MTKSDDILKELPDSVREILKPVWRKLTSEQRKEFQDVFSQLPSSLGPLKEILALVVDQYKPAFGNKRSIAIVGPANVGKSTLYNQLISRKEDRAAVGSVPGTTRQNQEADTGLFTLIDTPGADAVGEVGDRERHIAFEAARRADFLVIMFEASRGIKRYEKDLFEDMALLDKPFLVVLNKMDLIARRERDQVRKAAAANLRLEPSQVIDTIATQGTNVGRVILDIAKFEPELLAAIADALPEYRLKLAWQRIVPAAGAAGVVGLVPLPIVDLIPLLGIQSGLVLSIARIYGYKITPGRARELIATFGLGIMARTAFQELSKLGGVPGWILSASIAAATTVAIGYAATAWFSSGEKPTQQALQKIMDDVTAYLKDQLMSLGKKKPDQGTLRERITQSLRDLPRPTRPGPPTPSLAEKKQANQGSPSTGSHPADGKTGN